MIDLIAQVDIMLFGAASIWFVGRREEWRRWGYVAGLLSQPGWFYTTLHHEQYLIFAISLVYTYSWVQGFYNFWIRR